MDLVNHVHKVLEPVGHPATQQARPKVTPGISFRFFDQRPTMYGDGKPVREEAHCQIDVWTADGKSLGISTKVKEVMKAAGWRYIREEDGLDTGPGVYQQSLVFYLEFGTED